jgi:hypothetical protein
MVRWLPFACLAACDGSKDDSASDDSATPSDDSATDDSATDDSGTPAKNAVRNGDFSLDLKYWTNGSDRGPVGIGKIVGDNCIPAQKGNPFVYLNAWTNGVAWIEQEVDVPEDATTLSFRMWNALDPSTGTFAFVVDGKEHVLGTGTPPSVQVLKDPKDPYSAVCSGEKDTPASFDVSAFAGETGTLRLSSTSPGNNGTILSMDDIAID